MPQIETCDEKCRRDAYCKYAYSVNEMTILCMGYDFSYADSWPYLVSGLQNPWNNLDQLIS